ncbi:hypothetical protein HBI81_139020 [Parastagonospora nodorum]|nr:hypothetical protein HBH92_163640 [Parastagonospora nodorum]KAH4436443.1 hypothetical protein HBH93_110390 [Parastagonospora nodorum]KAH4438565.1 hypothetical protein HBH91_182610 [Parastagonospora nodorum]KAH4493129.1 hypothetical protein HBH89_164770 [Parastagonospora nodorum]KAH4550609.1 hypothetical protein HBH85_047160 [Parastagonospora nodorum]
MGSKDMSHLPRLTTPEDLPFHMANNIPPPARSMSQIPRPTSRKNFQREASRTHSPTAFVEPFRGTAIALVAQSPATEADIQHFILGHCEAIDKFGQELINPTGTKFAWVLTKEDLWPGQYYTNELLQTKGLVQEVGETVLDDVNKEDLEIIFRDDEADSDSVSEAARKMRLMRSHKGTSLAALIAGASVSDFLAGEDRIDTTSVHITPPSGITSKQSTTKSPAIPTKTRSSPPTNASPDNDTSPEVARVSQYTDHHPSPSLAALIAAADLSESSQEDSDTESDANEDCPPLVRYKYINTPEPISLGPCYDPTFPRHSPCATHEQLAYGKSAIAAIKLLRRRFEAEHDATGDGAWYREWIVEKGESGIPAGALMHGGSMLRYEIMYEDEEELENDEHYDESSFLYELDEDDLQSEEEVSLESSSPFDCTVGVYVHPIEEAIGSLSGDITGGNCENDDLRIKEVNGELHYGDAHWSHISTPPLATRTIHIRNASMNDAWGDLSSVRTSILSKRSMATTKSSCTSVSASDLDHSILINALDLGIAVHKSRVDFVSLNEVLAKGFRPHSAGDITLPTDERREYAISAPPTRKVSIISLRPRARDDDGSLCALGTWMAPDEPEHVASNINHPLKSTTSAVNVISPTNVEDASSTTASAGRLTHFVEHLDDADSEADYNPTTLGNLSNNKPSRREKWLGKMKSEGEKMSGQVQAAVKSTKMFTRTLVGFVPAALGSRSPFVSV